MSRLKSLFIALAVVAAVTTLVRSRLGESNQVDPGGWKAVDPS